MSDRLYMAGIRLLPRRRLSRVVRPLAEVRSRMAVRRFVSRYQVDMADAELPLEAYVSVHDLFTRKLRAGARPIDGGARTLVSPVDGRVAQLGPVGDGVLPQAKGLRYRVGDLLADETLPAAFLGGSFATLYLAPGDYHRIHSPADGIVLGYTHVPGDLFPVNPTSAQHVQGLYARNERLITHIDSEDFGRVSVVKVGATIVGRVQSAYDRDARTRIPGQRSIRREVLAAPVAVRRGDELGVFEMGSTVIVLSASPLVFQSEVGTRLAMGQSLGRGQG